MSDQEELRNICMKVIEEIPLPRYTNESERPDMGKHNDQVYEMVQSILQTNLDQKPLSDALRMLYEQQLDAGFIQDDLKQVKYFQCYEEQHRGPFFIGQYNPRRKDRSDGAGRKFPPPGSKTENAPNSSCFLCTDNVRWQQKGVQKYYRFPVSEALNYNALCNPFPFGPVHMTISADIHEPQSWREFRSLDKSSKINLIVSDLYKISKQLPSFVGFYNGVGAGATIEEHLHYHFFEIPTGQKAFPIQQAAAMTTAGIRQAANHAKPLLRLRVADKHYPLSSFRLYGQDEKVIHNVVELSQQWDEISGDYASANIIAIWEEGAVAMYFIPRNRFYSRSPGMSGIVGGLEALGEFIFCTESENQAINEQRVDYKYMWRILEAVRPPNSQMLR